MNISISTYQVKKEDTLQSVAEKLGISAEALKRYHNTYCELLDLLGTEITHQKELIVTKQKRRYNRRSTTRKSTLSSEDILMMIIPLLLHV